MKTQEMMWVTFVLSLVQEVDIFSVLFSEPTDVRMWQK